MAYENLSNEQLVSMVINTSHRVSILSESNDLIDLREELMSRLTKRAPDAGKSADISGSFYASNFIQLRRLVLARPAQVRQAVRPLSCK